MQTNHDISSTEQILQEYLIVIDRLEIGLVIMEPHRITASYTLVQGENVSTQKLIYKYEEDVFQPGDATSMNLASMIVAQVAVNYGLFCREILFRGKYDTSDQFFIRQMIENTAREIYVNKICWDHSPFLDEKIKQLPVLKLKQYTQAKLLFEDTRTETHDHWKHWTSENNSYAILSSGGKDSLLSYGLMKELGKAVHSIFINESGRHWFTALNAYRHLNENDPQTYRVWINSDRLFNWILRHIPFIRKDFQQIRADDYPLRLWTVAVFLFAAIPLMRKKGIGRLLIGDEYDTTRKKQFHGITHYDGLYDQSRYFDEAMSRYFLKKGWSIVQFSALRPVSELLIQKILVKRYPELQAHQISCHAAHDEGGRIVPCGKCEKCRRIVSMLLAWDEDPARCGYKPDQIAHCLEQASQKPTKQVGTEARHLKYVLWKKGLLSFPSKEARELRPYPETLMVKFDAHRSPFNTIPMDLRVPLLDIFLEYAEGTVLRKGRGWKEIDVYQLAELHQPYPFETRVQGLEYSEEGSGEKPKIMWGEMTWPEAETYLKKIDIALLPVGAIEQHGPHLPLDVDSYDAAYLARRVAEACSEPQPLVLPLVPFGVSYHHERFPGTISISNEAMASYIYDIGKSLAANGIEKLLIINGHGDNSPTLNFAAQMLNRDFGIFVCVDTGESSDQDINALAKTEEDVHAGEIETSTALATRPHLVKLELAQADIPRFSNRYLRFSSERKVSWFAHTDHMSRTGIIGDPTKASAEKGRRMWDIMIAHLISLVEEMRNLSLEELMGGKPG